MRISTACRDVGKQRRIGVALTTRAFVKAAFAGAGRMNRTMTAAQGAEDLGMDEQAVADVIAGLTAGDFDKPMLSVVDAAIRQDV